jgi:cell division protein FtsB
MMPDMFKRDSMLMRAIRNKYLIAILVFLVWLFVFDRNSLVDRIKYTRALKEMEEEKDYYLKRISQDSQRLEELKTDPENLEKFAREQFFMKKEEEDVFVIVEEED